MSFVSIAVPLLADMDLHLVTTLHIVVEIIPLH